MMSEKHKNLKRSHKQKTFGLSASLLGSAIKNNTFWEEIRIGNYRFTIKRIRDCDRLLEAVTDSAFAEDERFPYWAELWPSALALAEFVIEIKKQIKRKNILEIGCGLGLTGIAATACGARVLFSDHDPFALEFTQINFRKNFKRPAAVRPMDWREPDCPGQFDFILAADVLYEKRWLTAVLGVIEQCLKPHGTVLIAEPNRHIATPFFDRIKEKGWKHEALLKRIHVNDKLHLVTINRIETC
jgi:predicted nicotinamide N-methyase